MTYQRSLSFGDVLRIHELAQQMNRRDRDDRGRHLQLQRAGIQLAEPAELVAARLDVDLATRNSRSRKTSP